VITADGVNAEVELPAAYAGKRITLHLKWIRPIEMRDAEWDNQTLFAAADAALEKASDGTTTTTTTTNNPKPMGRNARARQKHELATQEHYEVEEILNVKDLPGGPSYLVTYKGWDPILHQHWVDEINADELVEAYIERQPESRRPRLYEITGVRTTRTADLTQGDTSPRKVSTINANARNGKPKAKTTGG
jgi:hypothetical protein